MSVGWEAACGDEAVAAGLVGDLAQEVLIALGEDRDVLQESHLRLAIRDFFPKRWQNFAKYFSKISILSIFVKLLATCGSFSAVFCAQLRAARPDAAPGRVLRSGGQRRLAPVRIASGSPDRRL